jgi:hypothetical protein
VTRSPALWLVAGTLAGYACYAAVRGVDAWQPVTIVFAVAAVAAAAGLVLERRWAAYAAQAILALLVASWVVALASIVAIGWPYRDGRGLLSLGPGVLAIVLSIAASAIVFRHFRSARRSGAAAPHHELREDTP